MEIEQFVENIQKYSSAMGENPKSACAKSGAGYSMWSNITRGRMPSIDRVAKLAHYLGVTVSELLGETPNPNALSDLPPDARAVAEAYVSASADDRLIVDTVLKKYKL